MELKDRIVIRTPLTELWTSKQILEHKRKRSLTKQDIREIIKQQPIEFMFAEVGHKLIWADKKDCFNVWKREIEKHILEKPGKVALEEYPDNYAYIASEWIKAGDEPIVLLEKLH